MYSIESLLSARLFISPKRVGARMYFISNSGQGGHLSLYVMDAAGSIPEPLLPPRVAMQNPELIGGESYVVLPQLEKILVMLDHDGDEHYRPMLIPIDGGFPEPLLPDLFNDKRTTCVQVDEERAIAYLNSESTTESMIFAYQVDLASQSWKELRRSPYGAFADAANADHSRVILIDGYSPGDNVVYEWQAATGEAHLLFGTPLNQRVPDAELPRTGISNCQYVNQDRGLLCFTILFQDTGGLGYLDLAQPDQLHEVTITGTRHLGAGEMESLKPVQGNRFRVQYNIDGCTWIYEGTFDLAARTLALETILCGAQPPLVNGKLEAISYDRISDRYAVAYSTATSPCQIYTVAGPRRDQLAQHTRERLLGLPQELLSTGEDASFTSHDGLRISARLYLPAARLGYSGQLPLVYYIHGGPQGQERPDFTWFSMPLIQYLTLQGFAVFVPNVRGSTGYGLDYMRRVERDWGGLDRLDHVHAMTQVLPHDQRLDLTRAGVIGRSYGGYMTLTLAMRHPDLWAAAVDMFGPYDLTTFMDRIPETWKPYMALTVGDPVKDHDFLLERSPRSYIDQLTCPMLVIQGQNDPRVIERESHDVVESLRERGKQVDYLVFSDEGHDVLKYANRVTCYTRIAEFFSAKL